MTPPRHDFGDAVRVVRNIRNDGTFPGCDRGVLLVRRGSVGYVRDLGTFLQDQLIYSVHFPDSGRLVGCREQELQPQHAPWVESRFDHRDRVRTTAHLAVDGAVVVAAGAIGEVLGVAREDPANIRYEVAFPGPRLLIVPERRLEPADG